MKYGGAVVVGGLIAGCASQSDSGSTPTEPSAGEELTTTDTSTTEDENYSVTMSPVRTVEFDSVPETAIAGQLYVVDYLVSFGLENRIIAASNPSALFTGYYEQLPGVSFDGEGLPNILSEGNISKEMLYELDADVHHIDSVVARNSRGFDEKDVEEIKSNIGPFFANQYSRAHGAPDSAADYQYYTLGTCRKIRTGLQGNRPCTRV
jgi:ABC-type Fe3+-hydroxamate transport system substrate-binding protein